MTAACATADLGRLSGKTLEIYDWGCGSALASCLLMDFLRELCVRVSVRRITLIEPSHSALKCGAELLARTLYGENREAADNGHIRTLCARFDDLTPDIIRAAEAGDVKIHLFANILDVDGVDGWRLARLIAQACPGRNVFLCVSPRYPASRIEPFARYFQAAVGAASVTEIRRNREPLTARIFDARQGAFKERVITRDEIQFAVEIPLQTSAQRAEGSQAEGTSHAIIEPFGRESFTGRAGRVLRRLFRGY